MYVLYQKASLMIPILLDNIFSYFSFLGIFSSYFEKKWHIICHISRFLEQILHNPTNNTSHPHKFFKSSKVIRNLFFF